MEPLVLPWTRDATEIPGPLPTLAEIEAASTVFPCIYGRDIRRTVLVNDRFVVKYGPVVSENEGQALWLVEKTTQVPAPRLYAMYRTGSSLYIVMEYIPGQRLCDIWHHLVDAEKFTITKQLRQACDDLRAVASPGFYGGALTGPVPHRYFFSHEGDRRITGPFQTEKDFSQALALKSVEYWKSVSFHNALTDFFMRHLATTLTGHDSVFTHADFQSKNILVEEDLTLSESLNGDGEQLRSFRLAAILDWESAGWYPSYWGYAACFIGTDWSDDWAEKMEEVFPPYVSEAAILKLVALTLDA